MKETNTLCSHFHETLYCWNSLLRFAEKVKMLVWIHAYKLLISDMTAFHCLKNLKTYFNISAGAKGCKHNHEPQAQDNDVEQGLSFWTHLGLQSLARGQPETSEQHTETRQSQVTPDTTGSKRDHAIIHMLHVITASSLEQTALKDTETVIILHVWWE